MLKLYSIDEVKKHYGVIYKLTSPSGKSYIGQSTNILNRFKFYKDMVPKLKEQQKIYNALIKYGSENFTYEILDICENNIELDNKEIFYIYLYDSVENGYNLQYGGYNGTPSLETKQKLSKNRTDFLKIIQKQKKNL